MKRVLLLVMLGVTGCGDPKPVAGPSDADSVKQAEQEQNAAAAAEKAAN